MLGLAVLALATNTIAQSNPAYGTKDLLDTGISLRGLVKLLPQDHENGSAVAFMFSGQSVTVVVKAVFDDAFPSVGKVPSQGQELTAAMFYKLLHSAAADSYVSWKFADQNPTLQRGDLVSGAAMTSICGVKKAPATPGEFVLECLAPDRKIEAGSHANFLAVVEVPDESALLRFFESRQVVWMRLED